MKNSIPIRVLIVDADPGAGRALSETLGKMADIEVVGMVHKRQTAITQAVPSNRT